MSGLRGFITSLLSLSLVIVLILAVMILNVMCICRIAVIAFHFPIHPILDRMPYLIRSIVL